jgi:hypothetical protein
MVARAISVRTVRAFGAACLVATAFPVFARDLNLQTLGQQQFRGFSEDLGSALSYKPLTPTEPLGSAGIDLGVAATATKLRNTDAFNQATGSDFGSTLVLPSLRLNKGLPAGFDLGLMGASASGTDIRVWGGELRYAVVKGDAVMPAIGIRGSYTKLTGVDQLGLDTKGLDVSISKGFLMFTPYLGVGRVWTVSDPHGVGGLAPESFSQGKVFGGLNINFGLVNLAFEADKTGNAHTYGAKLGFRF